MSQKPTPPYEPRGVPKAVIEYLRTLPAGTAVPSAELAELVGVSPAGEIHSLLDYAVRKGALVKRRDPADMRRQLWLLGDGTPPDGQADAEPDTDPPRQTVVPPSQWARGATLQHYPPKPAPARLRIGLFDDGELVIERGRERVTFTATETRQICAYLDRLAPKETTA